MLTRFRASFLRYLAAALVAAVSGVPQAAWAALDDDCCVEHCQSERDGHGCPPNCPNATCVKVFPSAVAHSRPEAAVAPERSTLRVAWIIAPTLPLVVSGVFHPPRA
jgi:hypothetical protein